MLLRYFTTGPYRWFRKQIIDEAFHSKLIYDANSPHPLKTKIDSNMRLDSTGTL